MGPYPLGGCSNVGNKKPKEDVRRYSIEQLMLTTLTKWLAMETSLLYLKKFPKTAQHGQSTETERQWARGLVLISLWVRGHNCLPTPTQNHVLLRVYSRNSQQRKCSSHGKGCNDTFCKAWKYTKVTKMVLQCAGWGLQGRWQNVVYQAVEFFNKIMCIELCYVCLFGCYSDI